jgi:hypothetical protein
MGVSQHLANRTLHASSLSAILAGCLNLTKITSAPRNRFTRSRLLIKHAGKYELSFYCIFRRIQRENTADSSEIPKIGGVQGGVERDSEKGGDESIIGTYPRSSVHAQPPCAESDTSALNDRKSVDTLIQPFSGTSPIGCCEVFPHKQLNLFDLLMHCLLVL